MKKDNIRLLCFICLFSASLICLCACRASPTFESPAPTEPAAQWGFGSAEEIVAALCSREMEGRTVGSRGGACAAEYIAGTFEAAGLAPFAGESFLLEYVDQVAEPLAAEPEVTVFAADGTQTQFTPGQDYIYTMPFQDFDMQLPVSGKKAECEVGAAFFVSVKYGTALEYVRQQTGRIAFVDMVGESALSGNTAIGQPGGVLFSVLSKDMQRALRAEGTEVCVRMKAAAQAEGTARNVAGCFPGKNRKEALLVLAHYDGSGIYGDVLYPSAYDNASGVAAMLRALALFAERGVSPERDVVFLATDGEESDKDGARAFAALLEERYASVNLINIDCIGHAGRDFIDIYTEKQAGINPLAQALAEAGTAQGARVRQEIYSGDGAVLGIGNRLAVTLSDALYEGEAPHTAEDVPERLDYARIEGAAQLVANYLAQTHAEPLFEYERDEAGETAATAEQKDRRTQLAAEHGLAWNEAYCVREDGILLRFYLGDTFETPEKFLRLFPGFAGVETGAYTLGAVELREGTWLKDGRVELLCDATLGTLMDFYTQQILPIETFTEGEKYTLSALDAALGGSLSQHMVVDLSYTAESGDSCLVALNVNEGAAKHENATLDAAELFNDAALEGIFLMPAGEAQDGSTGILLASYAVEGVGRADLFWKQGMAGTTLETMESLLREIDLKGILAAFLAPEFGK